jgi:MFS family permease
LTVGPFASPAFRWLCSSSVASAFGGGVERTATAWLALETGDALSVGVVLAARMLPSLLFGLAAGTLADRVDRTRQVAVVSMASVPIMAGMAWLASHQAIVLPQVIVLSFLAGCIPVFEIPARQSLVMDAVPSHLAPNGMAANALATRLALAAGAFGAGVLISTIGVATCYGVFAASMALAALLVVRVRTGRESHLHHFRPPFARALADAARLIVNVPAVRTLIVGGVACEVFAFSHPTALPVFARDVLGAGAEGLGTLNASISLGGSLAVLLLALLPARVRREPVLGAIFVVYGASLLALAETRSLVLAAGVLIVTGACAAGFDVLQQTLMQLAVPADQRGRAMGIWVLGIGSAPLGHLELGTLVAVLGAPAGLVVNGVVVLSAAATLLARSPRYRIAPASSSGAG